MTINIPPRWALGTVNVTNGSRTVTGVNTQWAQLVRGVLVPNIVAGQDGFQVVDGTRRIRIESLTSAGNGSNETITLEEPYPGATASGVAYSILRLGISPEYEGASAIEGLTLPRTYVGPTVTLAGSATLDLSSTAASTAYIVEVTGNPTIGTILIAPQTRKLVRCATGATYTHTSGVLEVQGGQSRTFAANDIVEVSRENGTLVRVRAYSIWASPPYSGPASPTAGRVARFANAAGAIEMTSSFFEDIATGRAAVGGTSPLVPFHVFVTSRFGAAAQFGDADHYLALSGGTTPIWQFDPNDYLYYDRGGNVFNLVIGGTVRQTVSAAAMTFSGNLGLGSITNPTESLHTSGAIRPGVNGSGASFVLGDGNAARATGRFYWDAGSGDNTKGHYFRQGTGLADYLVIENGVTRFPTGDVGVGITPSRRFHVASATGDTAVRIENTSGSVDFRLFGASLFIDQNINLGEVIFRFGPTYGQTMALNATTVRPGADNTFDLGSASFRWRDGRFNGIVTTGVYTVATLPAGVNGAMAYVTDANATTYNSIVAGGGSNRVRVSHDGTNWRIG